jgi:SAM-dependent methyltransferase
MTQVADRSLPTPLSTRVAGLTCPICRAPTRRRFQKNSYWIRECEGCAHCCAEITVVPDHAARVYDDRYFCDGGAGYPDYMREATPLRARGRQYARILSRFMKPGWVLDVGAAAGFLLEGLMDSGWIGAAVEPNPRMAEHARARLGVEVFTGVLEDFHTPEPFDLVAMIQVIGHFIDLQKALDAAAQATKPGAFWLIETWNRRSLVARALGNHWHEYSPPSVLQWFSPDGLQRLARQHGFREVARGRPAKRLIGAHAKSLVRYKLRHSRVAPLADKALRLIPDNLQLPYPPMDLFWALFQRE